MLSSDVLEQYSAVMLALTFLSLHFEPTISKKSYLVHHIYISSCRAVYVDPSLSYVDLSFVIILNTTFLSAQVRILLSPFPCLLQSLHFSHCFPPPSYPTFYVTGPKARNKLPVDIKSIRYTGVFKKQLNTAVLCWLGSLLAPWPG